MSSFPSPSLAPSIHHSILRFPSFPLLKQPLLHNPMFAPLPPFPSPIEYARIGKIYFGKTKDEEGKKYIQNNDGFKEIKY
jgi:hypothetical protein